MSALPGRAIGWGFLTLVVATALQSTLAFRLSFGGGQPDLPLTLALTAGLLAGAEAGALAGFAAGVFTAAAAGQTVGTYIVSRTLAGFVVGWLTGRFLRVNPGVIAAGVALGTVLAEALFGLSAPRMGLQHWARAALVGAAMNAALAVLAMPLFKRIGWGIERSP